MYDSPYHGDYPLGGSFEISPDGKYLISHTGTVLRLASSVQDDMKFMAKVNPHNACAFGSLQDILVTCTDQKMLQIISYPQFELRKSIMLSKAAYQMVFDEVGKTLFAALDNSSGERPYSRNSGRGPGNILIFDLSTVLP